MALVRNENAPWYERSGLIRLNTCEPYNYGVSGVATKIPLSFNFPIGEDKVNYLVYSWGQIYFIPQQTRVQNATSYDQKTWYLEIAPQFSGYSGEHVYYESTSSYARILVEHHRSSDRGWIVETILFSNGNIQTKIAYDMESLESNLHSRTGYIRLFYQDKVSADSSTSWTNHYLINYETEPENGESLFISRKSSSTYEIYPNSYYENDSTYSIPLKTKILKQAYITAKEATKTYFPNNGGFYSIPIYANSYLNSRIKVKLNNDVCNFRTQNPQTLNLINPPIYLMDNNIKKQISCGFKDTPVTVYRQITSSWGNATDNLYPINTSRYYWINPAYRYFDQPVSHVSEIHVRFADDTQNINTTNVAYVYYTDKAQDGLSGSNFNYAGQMTVTGQVGEYTDCVINVGDVTVGSIMIVLGISGQNANMQNNFDYSIYLGVKNGLQLI